MATRASGLVLTPVDAEAVREERQAVKPRAAKPSIILRFEPRGRPHWHSQRSHWHSRRQATSSHSKFF